MKVQIREDYDIGAVDEWCAANFVTATWKPVWGNGSICGWTTVCSVEDAMLIWLKFT